LGWTLSKHNPKTVRAQLLAAGRYSGDAALQGEKGRPDNENVCRKERRIQLRKKRKEERPQSRTRVQKKHPITGKGKTTRTKRVIKKGRLGKDRHGKTPEHHDRIPRYAEKAKKRSGESKSHRVASIRTVKSKKEPARKSNLTAQIGKQTRDIPEERTEKSDPRNKNALGKNLERING